ncbi:MAG: apoptosis-inducing factor 2 [Actinomycetota bacterium]|nr:apoptosis-inducing factor 2 [Actinomycetota bacterium]
MTQHAQVRPHSSRPTVVVVGGGYGGIHAARGLDEVADVVLVEPRDSFHHNVASLRALAQPGWLEQIFLPYDGLLQHGKVVRDRAIEVDTHSVHLASGQRIPADYVVLATGSRYPFPAKTNSLERTEAITRMQAAHSALAGAERVLLVGAGPVGIELAGEIRAAFPQTHVVLLDEARDVLAGPFSPRLRQELRRQLTEQGVQLVLGSPLRHLPPTEPGARETFTVETSDGREITADLWFRCYGVVPVTDYLGPDLAAARRPDGRLEVTPLLQLVGTDNVFVIGDISAADRAMAGIAGRQGTLVAANITALATGAGEVATWHPSTPGLVVPIGPAGGSGQRPGDDELLTPQQVSELKGRDMFVQRYADLLGATVDVVPATAEPSTARSS